MASDEFLGERLYMPVTSVEHAVGLLACFVQYELAGQSVSPDDFAGQKYPALQMVSACAPVGQ
jgi:hypothetical protein